MSTLWNELLPQPLPRDRVLEEIEAYLDRENVQHSIVELEQQRRYPEDLLAALRELELSTLFANEPGDPFATKNPPRNTLPHIGRLTYLLAQHSSSLAITAGVNLFGSLPVWMAGSDVQVQDQAIAIHAGESCALAMTEIDIGSDLMQIATTALPTEDTKHFLLSGTKDMINGGSRHRLITILARVDEGHRESPSLFRVRRDESVHSPERWNTAPVPAADISSMHLSRSPGELLGRRGRGFDIVAKTLTISRGAIGVFGFSTASKAAKLGVNYAMRRLRRGAPIIGLDPIAEHLLSIRAMEIVAGAMSLKTVAMLNHFGPAAVLQSCAAKLVCSELGEAATLEARSVHSANALMVDSPMHRLIRDAPLYGIFDGTSHVVLDLLQLRLEQSLAASTDSKGPLLPALRSAYTDSPRSMTEVTRLPAKLLQILPSSYLEELAEYATDVDCTPLVDLCRAVELTLSTLCIIDRSVERGARQPLARIYASVEALLASIELTDPGCRNALGMAAGFIEPNAKLLAAFARMYFAAGICRQLADHCPDPSEVDRLRHYFVNEASRMRARLLADRYETLQSCLLS